MLDILKKITDLEFLEIHFKGYPFQLKIDKEENLSSIFEQILDNFESKDLTIKNDLKKYIKNIDDNMIELEYKQKTYNIFINPVIFQLFYEKSPSFKVFLPVQLEDVLSDLQRYYYFTIDEKYYCSSYIVNLKKENKIQNKVIIIYPFIAKIFNELCWRINLNDLQNMASFNIDKEILEPYFLYIEELEINKDDQDIKSLNNVSLNRTLTFIMNEERKKFIKDLDEYALKFYDEPMIIIGNDGIGKTLTLQLYTLIELEGFKKFYFNLKLFEKIKPRDYFLIELMRGFISFDKTAHKNDFKKYIDCVDKFQGSDFSDIKAILQTLSEIMKYLRFTGSYIIILDQINFEKITEKVFNNFKRQIDSTYFKLIICCSLNDDKNKINLFSDYKNIEYFQFLDEFKNKISKKNDNKNIEEIKEEKEIKDKGINVNNFYLIKKRKRENERVHSNLTNINEIDKNITKDIIAFNDVTFKTDNTEKNEKEKKSKNRISDNKNKNEDIIINRPSSGNQNNFLDTIFPEKLLGTHINVSKKKQKIYYSNLISLEDMLRNKKESNNIIECMSEFNFLPKYYYKFNLFKANKILDGEKNIDNIIQSFYAEEIKRIKNNLTVFYSKMNLNKKEIIKKNDSNIYQNLLNLKKCIEKTYENSINFPKLYKYSLKFPFKYINIQIENETTDIKFDEALKLKKFKLKYSFPFIETVIDKMINEYDNEDKININELSGSAYGNALELKIRENLKNLEQKIEIRKLWSLDLISDKVKIDKKKEIEKAKKFHRISRFDGLEDIIGGKELKQKFFYFKPENQDNKLFDSLFLIKSNDECCIIALQITKNRDARKVKTKKEYTDFLEHRTKAKFEQLYGIKISKIYFWYILGNEIQENESLCSYLNGCKLKYVFYSIKDKCFYGKRNDEKIKDVKYFLDKESLLFPEEHKNIYDNIAKKNPEPFFISLFENMIYDNLENKNEIFYESTRKSFFPQNFGPKMEDKLKQNMIKELKNYIPYKNEFEILFLFSFPSKDISEFQNSKENNELVYLFKINNIIYILFKSKSFKIDNNTLKECNLPNINLLELKDEIKYHKIEFELSSMEDIYSNSLIYLYKIYYFGEELLTKD